MIVEPRVLEDTFIPKEVVHRDAETRTLARTLRPVLTGDTPDTAFLFGPSGSGKTCIARYTLDKLREQYPDFNEQYINCWKDNTRFKALYRVLEGVTSGLKVHRKSTPTDELIDRLEGYDGPPYIVILDEVDQLADMRVLYDLYQVPGLSTVMVANQELQLFGQLDPRVASRLQTATRIQFASYSVAELTSILEDRVRWGLEEDAVGAACLGRIADAASGDARVAISILRSAARRATEANLTSIRPEVIEAVEADARREVRQADLDRLNDDQQLLYDILSEQGELSPSALYERYQRRCEDPQTKRTMRNHLEKMQQYNLVAARGQTRNRMYRVVEAS